MNKSELVTWINELIRINRMDKFYNSKYWQHLKKEVLRKQHWECQMCKNQGKLTIIKNNQGVVHHCKFLRDFPELALSEYYIDEHGMKQRNLILLCHEHHEEVHERYYKREPITVERW